MKKFIEKLHFITHDLPGRSHIDQAQAACEAGAKWIQYRCLSKADDELLKDIKLIADICDDWGATLIVTDHVHLNGKADIQGFHIEDMDADFRRLRETLGAAVTLGGSATTLEGLQRIADEGADYAGFGPFTDTSTKPNEYAHLGIQGYRKAMHKMIETHPDFPVLAVGGVTASDIAALMQTGIFGIAASAAINQAEDMHTSYREFYDKIM